MELSLSDDFTMGYAAHLGFRASICTPFYFYDLELESSTKLKVHPFSVMDATLKYYLKSQPDEALTKIQLIIDGKSEMVITFLSGIMRHGYYKEWKGWIHLYSKCYNISKSD